MSEANAPTINTATTPDLGGTVEERANALFSASESVGEAGSPGSPPSFNETGSPADSGAQKSAEVLAQERAERRAKLDELNAKSRASVDAKTALKERDELRRKVQELEGQIGGRIDPGALDEEQFFVMAERLKVPPQKLYEWLQKRVDRPELAAIRSEVDPKLAALEKRNADLEARLDEFLNGQNEQAETAAAAEAAHEFASFTSQNAATSPYAARFLEAHGAAQFVKLAEGAARSLPPGAGPQALLDEIEENLAALGAIYAAPTAPQRPQANTPRIHAPAQAPTHVTNQLAQQRSRVVDEEAALENMSLEERASILFA